MRTPLFDERIGGFDLTGQGLNTVIGLQAKTGIAAETGAIDAQDAAAEGCQLTAIGSYLRPVTVECLG